MSLPYDPQDIDDDFANLWGDNTMFDPASLGNLDSSRDLLQSVKLEKTQPGIYPQPLDFLSTTSTHNIGQRGGSLGFDPLSNWVPGANVYPFQNAFAPNNAFFQMKSSQHNQPISAFDQRLLPYNIQYPTANEELAQDDPLSVYPLLDNGNASNSLPYGRWVIQQAQQAQQNCPLPVPNSYPINAGYAMNNRYQADKSQKEICQRSRRGSEVSLGVPKVSMDRAAIQRKDPKCDPALLYPDPETRDPWGSMTWNGQHLFSYTPKGQWLRDRCFNNEQLREYVDKCPKGTVFRVQQAPTQCHHRLDPEDRICRWANCPVGNRTITSGWLRVAFDEFPVETSNGTRDPLKCAGSMHLWCFEQVFDPVEFDLDERLKAEIRQFPFEQRNVTTLEKLTDIGIVRAAYKPWFEKRKAFFGMHGKLPVPRRYEDTLSYALNKYHLQNQTAARQRARLIRNNTKQSKEPKRTIDIHMGNLKTYVALTNKTRKVRKVKRLQQMREGEDNANPPADDLDSPDSDIWIAPPPTPRAKNTENPEQIASNSPAESSLETSPSVLQTKRCSPRGSNLKGTSARRPRQEYKRQALLPQPPVGRDHNLGMNTCRPTATVNLNANSTPPRYFDPLNLASRRLQSTLRSSLKIRIPSNNHRGSLANAYNSNHPQAVTGSSFNIGDQTQLGHSVGPPFMQSRQQQLFSSTAASPVVKVEPRSVIQGGNLNTPLEASQGNGLVEFYQKGTKALTQKAGEETLPVLGGSDGPSLNDSNQVKDLGPEDTNLYQFLTFDKDVPETTQYPTEGSTETIDNFIARIEMNADVSQPLHIVACTESPQLAAVAEPWDSIGSFMDPVNYGGYSDTNILTLFDDFAATTDGTTGESRNG